MTNAETLERVMESFNSPELKFLDKLKEETLKKLANEWLESQGFSKEDMQEYGDQLKNAKEQFIKEKRKLLTDAINEIKMEFANLKEGIALVSAQVKSIISNLAMPAVISVPPGAPNPLFIANDVSQKKGILNKILFDLNMSSVKILNAAIKAELELPVSVLNVMGSIAATKKLLDTIPI